MPWIKCMTLLLRLLWITWVRNGYWGIPSYGVTSLYIFFAIEKFDNAGECFCGCPCIQRDSHPAGDAVRFILFILKGIVVCSHFSFSFLIGLIFSINLPDHRHVVRVKVWGHAHQGRILRLPFFLKVLVTVFTFRWRKHLYCRCSDLNTILWRENTTIINNNYTSSAF